MADAGQHVARLLVVRAEALHPRLLDLSAQATQLAGAAVPDAARALDGYARRERGIEDGGARRDGDLVRLAAEMVVAGRGIGLLPDLPSEATRDLVRVLPDKIGAEGQVFLSMGQCLSDSRRGRRLKALIEKSRRHLLRE